MTDQNTPEYLDKLREAVFEVLRDKNAAPSVPLQGGFGIHWVLGIRLREQRCQSWLMMMRMRMRWRTMRTRISVDPVSGQIPRYLKKRADRCT
jgi:hypothetical protein